MMFCGLLVSGARASMLPKLTILLCQVSPVVRCWEPDYLEHIRRLVGAT